MQQILRTTLLTLLNCENRSRLLLKDRQGENCQYYSIKFVSCAIIRTFAVECH